MDIGKRPQRGDHIPFIVSLLKRVDEWWVKTYREKAGQVIVAKGYVDIKGTGEVSLQDASEQETKLDLVAECKKVKDGRNIHTIWGEF